MSDDGLLVQIEISSWRFRGGVDILKLIDKWIMCDTMAGGSRGGEGLPWSESGTDKAVKARSWPWLLGLRP
jgi:hypothetical protein